MAVFELQNGSGRNGLAGDFIDIVDTQEGSVVVVIHVVDEFNDPAVFIFQTIQL